MINEQIRELSKLYDTALEYDIDIQTTVDTIVEYRTKMFDKKDSRILKSIIPLLDTLIYEANQYKEWIEQMANTGIYLGEWYLIKGKGGLIMGCVETIAYDKFPKQRDKNYKYPEMAVGARVKVCFHYDTSKYCMGTIVRSDIEEPFEEIIRLDDGRFVRTVECQYSYAATEPEKI